MKKIFFLLTAITIGFGAMAQGNGHGKGKNKQGKKYEKNKEGRFEDDRFDDDRDNVNDRIYGRKTKNDGYRNDNGKSTKNAPRKVRDAFYRDYPNASNVAWTKERGVWTARFNRGGIFGGSNTVSYQANGQRVGSDNNTVYRRNGDRTTTQQGGGTVWDKVMKRPQ